MIDFILPASPDKVAALLLLAKNECVGVSSLLTMLLSHGLSCRRRAECHHIRKMLDRAPQGLSGTIRSNMFKNHLFVIPFYCYCIISC